MVLLFWLAAEFFFDIANCNNPVTNNILYSFSSETRCGDGAKWIHVVCMSLYENAYKRHTITVLIITNNLLDSGLMKHQKSELSQALKNHVRVHKTNEPPNIHKKINNYKSVSLYTLVFSSIHTTKFFNIIHQFHFFACCI